MQNLNIIKKLTLTSGISGYESQVAAILKSDIGHLGEIEQDRMGSVSINVKGEGNGPKIQFMAHMDEIGFIVADILSNGFLKLQNIGGWDPNTLLSSPVEVINTQGEIYPGVIGSVPVHFLSGGSGKLEIDKMFVDIGSYSKEQTINEFGIHLGDPIIPVTNYHFVEKTNTIFSKAFDNRIGVASLIALGNKIEGKSHPNTVVLTGSVQEEVGVRGARSIAGRTDADVCIIIEGAPADDIPGIAGNSQTSVGKGAHVRLYDPTMLVKAGMKNFIIETAKKYGIKVQTAVRKRGGTDGSVIHTASLGIPTIVLGVPVRYAHSHNCSCSLNDFNELVKLLEQIVLELDNDKLLKIIG